MQGIFRLLIRFISLVLGIEDSKSFPPPLAQSEERELFLKKAEGDTDARNKLIEHNLRLVSHIIKKYYASYEFPDELFTFQNYFRLYDKLSGMTGTAMTEEEEFGQIYHLDIIEIPTNRPVARIDQPDTIYKTQAGKYRAVVEQIKACHAKGQPVLVGTVSIEISELVSKMLTRAGVKHNVLNAKHHEKEAEIVAQAGKLGAVTVATNMAGRGTDIQLGGNAEFMAKSELRKKGMSDELLAEATGHAETDNQEILEARRLFAETEARYKEIILII